MNRRFGRRALRPVALSLVLIAAGFLLVQAGWVHAKAELAQWLLQRAWHSSQQDQAAHSPWPWADTHPVARLQAPGLGIAQIVLQGDSGRVLAFGPGWAPASAEPTTPGNTVLSGHRDTHFAWLKQLRTDDLLVIEGRLGRRSYRVVESRVVDSRQQQLALDPDHSRLTLVTCWPFDAVRGGGPMRYVVSALAVDEDGNPRARAEPR